MGPSRSRPLMAPLVCAVDRKLRSPFMNIFKRCESDSMRVRRSRLNLAPNRGMNAQRYIRLVEVSDGAEFASRQAGKPSHISQLFAQARLF